MKSILLTVIILTIVSVFGYSQNSGITKQFENNLRHWYPIGVQKELITLDLKEGKKAYSISTKKMSLKSPTSGTILVDEIISVQLSTDQDIPFPAVLYLVYNGVCTGMLYMDLFSNLSKWEDVLKNAETVDDNHFVVSNMIHFIFKLSPKERAINIQIDVVL